MCVCVGVWVCVRRVGWERHEAREEEVGVGVGGWLAGYRYWCSRGGARGRPHDLVETDTKTQLLSFPLKMADRLFLSFIVLENLFPFSFALWLQGGEDNTVVRYWHGAQRLWYSQKISDNSNAN